MAYPINKKHNQITTRKMRRAHLQPGDKTRNELDAAMEAGLPVYTHPVEDTKEVSA